MRPKWDEHWCFGRASERAGSDKGGGGSGGGGGNATKGTVDKIGRDVCRGWRRRELT